jgi:hypothetical protein
MIDAATAMAIMSSVAITGDTACWLTLNLPILIFFHSSFSFRRLTSLEQGDGQRIATLAIGQAHS